MNKCSPVEMRKNMQVVEALFKAGIDFAAIPALNEDDKNSLLKQSESALDEISKCCEE